jgi:hypothetical protein
MEADASGGQVRRRCWRRGFLTDCFERGRIRKNSSTTLAKGMFAHHNKLDPAVI